MTDITNPSIFDTEEGKAFANTVETLIADNHEQAEKNPELARDYVQRAKGARDVLKIIQSTQAVQKKP